MDCKQPAPHPELISLVNQSHFHATWNCPSIEGCLLNEATEEIKICLEDTWFIITACLVRVWGHLYKDWWGTYSLHNNCVTIWLKNARRLQELLDPTFCMVLDQTGSVCAWRQMTFTQSLLLLEFWNYCCVIRMMSDQQFCLIKSFLKSGGLLVLCAKVQC